MKDFLWACFLVLLVLGLTVLICRYVFHMPFLPYSGRIILIPVMR